MTPKPTQPLMNRRGHFPLFALLTACLLCSMGNSASAAEAKAEGASADDPLAELDRYNVVWDSPSQNAAGSMPIGNGEVGLNVWVETNGDLLFYISRTDTWSECNRLLKLGRVRVTPHAESLRQGDEVPARVETSSRPDRDHRRRRDGAALRGFRDAGDSFVWLRPDAAHGDGHARELADRKTCADRGGAGLELDHASGACRD